MIASLTGFGRAELTDAQGRVAVEIKSVNNRFLQIDLHLPYGFNWAEGQLRNLLHERISRGKVNLHLEVVDYAPSARLIVNRSFLQSVIQLHHELEKETGRQLPLNLDGCLALSGAVKMDTDRPDAERLWARIQPVVEQAVAAFVDSRLREGANMAADLRERRARLAAQIQVIEERLPAFKQEFMTRFAARIKELAGVAGVDENRIAVETAIWADRSDISEEITRLKSHLQELEKALQSKQPIGRRLDFLAQELHREANTISNKIGDLLILQQILDIKCEIEKIREQVQNIE
ncbi:MAG: YicC family protein [Candidatus Ozemobacter sibiricus]|jgi:uncharacterized protein (TIGR00255 family)|uniref:YicC family protein n=1 Tax=Candidatus Ozemobacter sibiricus TaxID=2268124 RepID=A0A367ZQJ1_9BACT|nr:MAG: YicC family protein [Candidatus Ozemobacter sibiricus]